MDKALNAGKETVIVVALIQTGEAIRLEEIPMHLQEVQSFTSYYSAGVGDVRLRDFWIEPDSA